MRNLKRALAVLVVVTMMISSSVVSFASSFSDVKDGSSVANAVNVGVGLNLFKGYEDGTFKPDGDITRAEFAAIVVRMLGQEAQADGAKGATSFTDVKADNWAAGYINIVTRLGIVNGYGDGTFGPEDKVTYEQAIKMIIVSLGYSPSIGSAGYPVGYLTKAGELGITSGVAGSNGVAANRGTVAQLVFNSLDVPLMQQTGYGTNLDFVVQDGYSLNALVRKTVMSEYLDVVKLQVTVDKYEATTSTAKDNNNVLVSILNAYKTRYNTEFVAGMTNFKLDAGKSTVADLVGSKAIVYVAYDDNSSDTPVVVFAKKDTTKTDEVTVKSADVESAVTDKDVAAHTVGNVNVPAYFGNYTTSFEYWANPTDKKTEKVTIAKNAKLYVNGVSQSFSKSGLTDLLASYITDGAFYGEVTLAKNDTDVVEDYDTVFVTNYANYVVDEVNTKTFKVSSKNSGSISFDPDATDVKSTLYDSKGVEMKWTDLKEWDVISAKVTKGTSKTITVATLVTDKVNGKITEVNVTDSTDTSKNEFTIDGKVYKIDSAIQDKLLLEDEGTFYLDIMGNICYYDTTAALNTNYAYVYNVALNSGIDNRTEIKLYTKKGEFVTLKTASKVKLDGKTNITSETLTTTPQTSPVTVGLAITKIAKGDFVTYDVNTSNEITKIDRANTANLSKTDVKGVFAQYGQLAGFASEYDDSSKSLTTAASKVYVTDKTVIIIAPGTSNEDDYELVNVASIADEQKFPNATFYNINANREVGAVLVGDSIEIESATTGIAAVTGSSQGTNATGDTVTKLKALQNGAATTLSSSTDYTITSGTGTALIPVLNTKGEVKGETILAVPTDSNNTVAFTRANTRVSGAAAVSKVSYTFGTVVERRSRVLTLNDVKDIDVSIPSTANVYVYDERSSSSSNRVTIGDITDFDAKLATQVDVNAGYATNVGDTFYDASGDKISKVYAIAREYDGKIVDVMIYIFK